MGFSDIKPKLGGDKTKLEDLIDVYNFPKSGGEVVVRFLDFPFLPVKRHWIKIQVGDQKKEISIPKYCLGFNPEDESENPEKCPYCSLEHGNEGPARVEFMYLANVIVREDQENEPRKKPSMNSSEKSSGFKDVNSKTWTPVKVFKIKPTLAARIQKIAERNVVKAKKNGRLVKKSFDVTHPKYGIDIAITFDPDQKGTAMYSADKAEEYGDHGRTPLSEEESNYLVYNLTQELVEKSGLEDLNTANQQLKRMDIAGGDDLIEDDEDDDDEDRDLIPKSRKRKSSSSTRRRKVEDDFDDEEDDEEEKPRRRKRKSSSSTRRRKVEEDFDEEDDEEEKPRRRKRPASKKPSTTRRRRKVEEDFDEEDDDFDEEEKPRRRKRTTSKKPSTTRRRKVTDDFDDEDDDFDDDTPF